MLHVADDADDFRGRRRLTHHNSDAFAKRVFVREILSGQGLVNDNHVARLADFLLGEEAAALKWNLQRLEKVLIGDANVGGVSSLTGQRGWTAGDFKPGSRAQTEERSKVDCACRFDTGHGSHPFEGLREEVDLLPVLVVATPQQCYAHSQHVLCVEARIHRLQSQEAANQQARADQQDKRQSDLSDDQSATQSLASPVTGEASARRFQSIAEFDVRRFKRGEQTKDDAGNHGHHERETQHRGANFDALKISELLGSETDQYLRAPPRQQQSGCSARGRQQKTLRQQLPRKAPAPGTQRGAHGDLFLPRRAARQLEIRHVGAGNQQYKADRAHQHQQRQPNLAGELLTQRNHVDTIAAVEFFVLLGKTASDGVHFTARPLQSDPEFEPPDGRGKASTELAQFVINGPWPPQFRRMAGLRILSDVPFDIGRQYTDDGVFRGVENYLTANNVRVAAKPALPQTSADDDYVIPSRLAIFRCERAAPHGIHTQDGKQIVGACLRGNLFRLAIAGEIAASIGKRSEAFKDFVLVLPIKEVGGTDRILLGALVLLPQDHQAVGIAIWERTKQHCIDDAEDCRVGSDAESEREDGNGREPRLLKQAS